jgi:photosystem I subunit 9
LILVPQSLEVGHPVIPHPIHRPSALPNIMKKFLTTAPVFAAIWFTITAGIMIEFNRFYPDLLFHPL